MPDSFARALAAFVVLRAFLRYMIRVFTITLNGMPWLPSIYTTLMQFQIPWHWVVVEGAAKNVNCTKWCREIPPQWSTDGTHEFLLGLFNHPRVSVIGRKMWEGGKVEMCNAAMERFDQLPGNCRKGVVIQQDSDEIWTASQLQTIHRAFETSNRSCAYFKARYFVGPNIICTADDAYGNNHGEWLRAWRWMPPHMRFLQHEPPKMAGMIENPFTREETAAMGCVFDHYAYCHRKAVEFKQEYYKYDGAVAAWERLQANKQWPVKLKSFLPWVDDRATADLLIK